MSSNTAERIITRLAARTIGVLAFLFGLLLLCTSVVGIVKVRSDIGISVEGFIVMGGILFLACAGLYFLWMSYTILVRKRINFTIFLLLSSIPSIFVLFAFWGFIERFWGKQGKNDSFLLTTILLVLSMAVFLIAFFFIGKAIMRVFPKNNDPGTK